MKVVITETSHCMAMVVCGVPTFRTITPKIVMGYYFLQIIFSVVKYYCIYKAELMFMSPTLKQLVGHIAFGMCVRACLCHSFCASCNFGTVHARSWNFIYEPRHDKTCLREFPTRPDTNRPAQPQKIARVLKIWLKNLEILYYLSSEEQRRWSDCADAQSELRLCCLHMT